MSASETTKRIGAVFLTVLVVGVILGGLHLGKRAGMDGADLGLLLGLLGAFTAPPLIWVLTEVLTAESTEESGRFLPPQRSALNFALEGREYARLYEFLTDFARRTHREEKTAHGRPNVTLSTFSGTLSGRKAKVAFETRPEGLIARFAVAADAAAPLKIERDSLVSPTHETGFDAKYFVTAPGEPSRRLLHKGSLRAAIDELFHRFRIRSIRLEGGELVVEGLSTLAEPGTARALLEALDRLAHLVERVPLEVKVLGGERRALKSEHGAARCSYCHGDLTGDEPDLVACALCSTVLHEGCWAELGRCPVLGCEGKSPERARAH
jgi:hypothetical protein